MFTIKIEQKIYKLGGVKIGGIPGKDPTVLIGTIFYRKQKIVLDEHEGLFDKKKAETFIRRQEELSDITGNPCMLNIEGSTSKALEKFIDFAADSTDIPFLIGGSTVEIRRTGLKHVVDIGIKKRVFYNSLMPGCSIA